MVEEAARSWEMIDPPIDTQILTSLTRRWQMLSRPLTLSLVGSDRLEVDEVDARGVERILLR